jgi:cell division protein FtsB
MSRKRKQPQRPGDEALATTRAERRRVERAANKGRASKATLLAMLIGALLVSSMYPARTLVAKRAHIAALKRQSESLDRQIAALKAQREALQTDGEVERIARTELGMIRRGETAFAVVPAQSPLPAPPAKTARPAATKEGPGVFSRWWDAFSRSMKMPR